MDRAAREQIVLLIADDHRILTDTLVSVVQDDPRFRLAGPPAHSAEVAVEAALRERPDVVLMDVDFGGQMDGFEATRRIKERLPQTAVVVMTADDDPRLLVQAVQAGASGFLRKTEGVDDFLGALKAAAAGEVLVDRGELARLLPMVNREREAQAAARLLFEQLTHRERAILELSAQGLRTQAVAERLGISPQTAQTHIRNTLAKLGVHSKLQAVALAIRSGAVEL
jgi:DNA-binding NarL/FixJ family response regulator